uniref:MFS domain-containing protein n=1 Tax=Rhodnius prolixus TaxID=13249 RepID=T1IFV1_RHOPR
MIFGRKTTLLFAGPLTVTLWTISLFTKNIVVLHIIRILQGVALASIVSIAPVYLAEISAANRRGVLCGNYAVVWNLATLYSFINSEYLSFDMYTLSLIAISILFCSTFIFMPESPYFYFMKNKPDKAKSSLQWLRYNEDIEKEYLEIEEAVREDMKNAGSWIDLVATKKDRRALLIVQIVALTRFLVGINLFAAYAEDIFTKAGSYIFTPNQQAIGLVLLFTVSSAVASFFSDIVGRRKLLIYSLIGTAISNIIIALYFGLLELTSLQVTPYVWIMYIGSLGCSIFTNIGVVQLMPTVKAEFFPSHTRSKGSALTTFISAFAIFAQLAAFPVITKYIGMYFNFILFTAAALIGYVFALIYVPESAGKTLAEVNETVDKITSC